MYHIANDKRAKQSAELIYHGLLSCIQKKPFDQITISDLQKASGVARTTFYRAFDNISDVLYWKCDVCFHEVLGEYRPSAFPGELELARHYFQYWMEHSDILELLIQVNRLDIIYACHMKNAEILRRRFGSLPDVPVEHGHYFVAIRTGFTISVLTAWLQSGRRESTEEIVEIIQEQLRILAKG
ncbi:MAG TPA: TetR/AcrR family transcriptional regulator [Candidatus Avichristensenella intestinipullorum]|uniref:TetR/AcrR family transcriptional regulator n=1 Tax=Candidatus Avichristensenella intestinipullorum TaxID=2840693 RepID=A0A9D0YUL4_9FIRM|nr:TetR/AcrR family transcriptional regulator [Candidatus Avichristensenella intestinipullorum]